MANIFTIKIGSPNLANSPLLEGELGFHIDNNTLYIGHSNGNAAPVGGTGAFVPWNNADESKTLFLGSLTLKNPLATEYGGTGVTDLEKLTFSVNQITDLSSQGFLKKESLEEVGFTEENGNWSLDINNLKIGGEDVATQNWVEGKGYLTSVPEVNVDLTNYYTKTDADDAFVNVEGDTMKGTLLFSENPNLYFRNKNNSNSGEIYCGSFGQLGLIAKGNNENRRELRINSHSLNTNNNSALELIINNSSYKVYHTGWPGDLQLYARATSSGSYYRSIQILGPNTNGVSDRNALRYQTYWGSPYTFTIYHSNNIIYSESEPTQDVFNGMIWLKPAT